MTLDKDINAAMHEVADRWNTTVGGYGERIDKIVEAEAETIFEAEDLVSAMDSVIRRSGLDDLQTLLDEIDSKFDVYGKDKYERLSEHYRFCLKRTLNYALWNRLDFKLSEVSNSTKMEDKA